MSNFAVVTFTDEDNCIAVVPAKWLDDNICYWPEYEDGRMVEKAIKHLDSPDKTKWLKCRIRLLSKADTYEKARQRMIRAEDTSNIETDVADEFAERPQRKRKARKLSSSDDDSDTGYDKRYPPPPPVSWGTPFLAPVQRKHAIKKSAAKSSGTSSTVRVTQSTSSVSRAVSSYSTHVTPSSSRETIPSTSSVDAPNMEVVAQMNGSLRMILQYLAEQKSELKDVKSQVKKNQSLIKDLLNREPETESGYELPPGMIFPLNEMGQLDEVEELIKSDKDFEKYLVNRLHLLGGFNVKDCVRAMFGDLFTNALQRKLNWTGLGAGNKRAFSTLKVKEVIERAIRKNNATAKMTSAEFQTVVVRYLKGSADRQGGRSARDKRRDPAEHDQGAQDDQRRQSPRAELSDSD